jgi:hypothetical protein
VNVRTAADKEAVHARPLIDGGAEAFLVCCRAAPE